jgi:hypothetical protein
MRTIRVVLVLALVTAPLAAATFPRATRTTSDASCDIAVLPAATLLLPYFDVDLADAPSATTRFTVQNASAAAQIVHVTIWTDWAFPVMSFPLFLAGYDVQSIDLYDVLARGVIARGMHVLADAANPHFLADAITACASERLPVDIPASVLDDIGSALTRGVINSHARTCANGARIGGTHAHAIGYVTIDVVATCAPLLPTSPAYFASTILFDNVLTGEYQQVSPHGATRDTFGGPLVHIRAMPEGGAAGALVATSLPYTFYDRLTNTAPSRTFDRRQPLPSAFAPRVMEGGASGFLTTLKIWREAVTNATAACDAYAQNGQMELADVIRFDEHDNAVVLSAAVSGPAAAITLPATSATSTASAFYPPNLSDDTAGSLYLDVNNGGSKTYSVTQREFRKRTSTVRGERQSQAWVITSIVAEPAYAVESAAAPIGNGCSASTTLPAKIGPLPNENP